MYSFDDISFQLPLPTHHEPHQLTLNHIRTASIHIKTPIPPPTHSNPTPNLALIRATPIHSDSFRITLSTTPTHPQHPHTPTHSRSPHIPTVIRPSRTRIKQCSPNKCVSAVRILPKHTPKLSTTSSLHLLPDDVVFQSYCFH